MSKNHTWLHLTQEETLEPDLPICDAHHHLWEYPNNRYLLEEYLDDTAKGHNIISSVFVECLSGYLTNLSESAAPTGETKFVQELAIKNKNKTAVAAGIVSFADLLLGDPVAEILEAHIAMSPNRFKGIRHACGWDASPLIRNSHTQPPKSLYLDKNFRTGFAKLSKYNLTFDAWLYHAQLGELLSLARAFPEQPIILDHVGGPLGIGPYKGKRTEILTTWKSMTKELAKCDNIIVKLGGISMAINGFEWHKRKKPPSSEELAEATRPYLMHCIEAFTPQRCMFESNFPVDKVSCSYNILWNSFKRITKDFSADEKCFLYQGVATKTYNLSDSAS
ncbi:MAG: amidohydrolase family protein [Gammaproteobacteria bacterium]|nr:amidohydrolase family protein [Gammaproteobacteria bacterium]